jgi:hypothetical protein
MSLSAFVEVLLHHVHRSEFLVQTQNIPVLIVSEIECCKSHTLFLECTVVITLPHCKSVIYHWNVAMPRPSQCK